MHLPGGAIDTALLEDATRREAEAAIVQANNEIEHVETRATQMAQFGPAFPLVHGQSGP